MSQRAIVILSFSLFVAALVWGGYNLLVYLGIPLHQLVYTTADEIRSLDLACGQETTVRMYLCRGGAGIFPFVMAFFRMASPFFPYIIVSFILFGAFLLRAGYKTGYFGKTVVFRPIYVIVFFIFSVWLFGTTFSLGSLNNLNTPEEAKVTDQNGIKSLPPFNRFYEPLPQVYNGASAQAIQELQTNYQSLLKGGCLTEIGQTQNGAKVYDMSAWCVQKSMFARVGSLIFLTGFFLLILLSLGRFLLKLIFSGKEIHPLLELVFSIGVGALGFVAILYVLAVASLLKSPDTGHGSTVARILFAALPLVFYKHSWHWIKSTWQKTFNFDISASWFPVLAWLLISYLALNFLNVIRPFPIGWDDLGSYLNRPRLLSSYGYFIPSMSQFQWEYLTSLGFLLFGYDSILGSTLAMEINWLAGLVAAFSVYAFGRFYFGEKRGVIAAIMYYFLPMVGHFSFADMKIDNASFFTSALAILAVFAALFPPMGDREEETITPVQNPRMLIVAGLLMGFSFAIKPTAILDIFLIASTIAGAVLGAYGFAAMAVFGFAILMRFGPLGLKDILMRADLGASISPNFFFSVLAVSGLILLGIACYRRREMCRKLFNNFALLALGTAVAVLPWMLNNMVIAKEASISAMLSARDFTAPQVTYEQAPAVKPAGTAAPTRYLPPELKLDENSPACKTSARKEELDRYWGFETGLKHYLTLPWRQVMNIDAFGYYVTLVPVLLMVPLILFLPAFWTRKARWLRILFTGTMVFLVQWILVANGIPWYGIGMFLGFALILEAFIALAPDIQNRYLAGFFIAASILISLINRFWQFDTQKNLFEYPLGKITASALREVTIPDYDDIRESVVARHEQLKDTPYTYRIGTFISYFIPRNREIFPLADHQLSIFNCLDQERNHELTLRRLKALGFNSIIFDTNTATIEKDLSGSLHQKVNAFLDFVNDPVINLNLVVNDPGNGIAYIVLP
ncbi:hypothetical protein A3J34_02025 [Candidatus Peribacteria bacterium RIFCSPLOWO2_02_FULL_51_10]|nr:MAG: hypothetical protein A3C52_01280 [Candidatus Peribacteria bacterium RIFCSPHIGHO2_02_FULL_51_15]OGJ69139.1 MAG: hypothetical protein A3J34_02025 [Candidatus Peribacteria bacterium RIFCSPLOWO2_02_FULL_51_10]